ncbi:MAG TPA: hypothetical protein VM509_16070, partial [Planctomycetota bacterium]|nr:hypothetical protein [Planctomycetota bacterium]
FDISGGRRVFLLTDSPLYFDLEDFCQPREERLEPPTLSEDEREWLELARGVRVVEAGYCRGTQDHLSLYQTLVFPNASRWIAKLERAFLDQIEGLAASGEFEKSDATWLDSRSRELWIAMAREKRDWLSLEDGVLTVDLPVTSACAASWISRAAKLEQQEGRVADVLDQLFSHLSELRIADDHLILRWKLEGLVWTFRVSGDNYDERLAQSLRDSKSVPEKLPSWEAVTAPWRAR